MAKWVAADVLDAALGVISGASRMVALADQPADYQAATGGALAAVTMAPADFATAAAGGGRRVAVAAKESVPVNGTGVARHVALLSDPTQRLLYVTTCPDQALEAGGTVSIGEWGVEIGAPV